MLLGSPFKLTTEQGKGTVVYHAALQAVDGVCDGEVGKAPGRSGELEGGYGGVV